MKDYGILKKQNKMIKPNVKNEWGDLKEIIVGSAINAQKMNLFYRKCHQSGGINMNNNLRLLFQRLKQQIKREMLNNAKQMQKQTPTK